MSKTMAIKSSFKSVYFLSSILCIILFSYAFSNFSTRVVSVAVSKMNVLYIGMDNPIVVAISDVPSDQTSIESDDLEIEFIKEGHFVLRARTPGKATIKIKANGELVKEEIFRIKRIPDPIARINQSNGGMISSSELKASQGVHAYMENFDIDATCKIMGYDFIRTRGNADPMDSRNIGAKYETATRNIINKIKVGDMIYIDNIKCKCPGDRVSRAINSLVFQIK